MKVVFALVTEDGGEESELFTLNLPNTKVIWTELKDKAAQDGDLVKIYMTGDGDTVVMQQCDGYTIYNIQYGPRDGMIIDEKEAKKILAIH